VDKAEKERVVAELAERLRTTETLIVADYRGLTMPQIDDLRTKLLEQGARFQVVKNTLTRRAAELAGADQLLALLDGPTAIAFLESNGDPIAVAKALAATAKETQVLHLKGGIMEGRVLTAEELASLATLPSADVIRAQVLGAIASPLYAIVGLFTAPLRDLAGLIDARIEQLGGHEESPAEAEAEPAQAEPTPEAEATAAAEPAQAEQPPAEAEANTEADATASADQPTEQQPEEEEG
jgi:large subunit ribosomal protein L10